jgi:ubiquinone/menaquinone biosynthesis C-methylase UbiE
VLVIEIEPSPDFAPGAAVSGAVRVRARAEALPMASASVDAAVSVSAIRHVADRGLALAELRRVVRPGGVALIVELDPEAPPARIASHARGVRSWVMGAMFGPLVVATAPPADVIAEAARRAGWQHVARRDDTIQPVYELRLW